MNAAPTEPGEMTEDGPSQGDTYHPSLEWPGEETDAVSATSLYFPAAYQASALSSFDAWGASIPGVFSSSSEHGDSDSGLRSRQSQATSTPSLRLLRVDSANISGKPILPPNQMLAILDGYTELQFGRDVAPPGNDQPRIRLKEMEVSKLHATVYWDVDRREWAVVDMGSKHGTFSRSKLEVGSSSNLSHADPRGHRLSPPRVSSVPRRLRHLDQLSVGTTSFVVHIHEDSLPCAECSSKGNDEIPLFGSNKTAAEGSKKRKREEALGPLQGGDSRNALNMLKRSLLSRHSPPSHSSAIGSYVDRSARRRALHPDTPTPPLSQPDTPSFDSITPRYTSPPPVPPPSPPAALPSTNIGHRLLMKQGWTPGTALRSSESDGSSVTDSHASIALVDPIESKGRTSRTGLGLPEPSAMSTSASGLSWKDEGKFRRWAHLPLTDPR